MRQWPPDIGQRIVEAARLATAMHLEQSLRESPYATQRHAIGGAGSCGVGGADPQALQEAPAACLSNAADAE